MSAIANIAKIKERIANSECSGLAKSDATSVMIVLGTIGHVDASGVRADQYTSVKCELDANTPTLTVTNYMNNLVRTFTGVDDIAFALLHLFDENENII